ncbi:hypothetical protein T265_08619 [Opisthorchis viverrini]|uniref:Uncharacterized protein n=1 Tax=Opisthorchis viverrini TaxID=6198 RepID=A0A074Z8F5_OPIVI|nr:hypothetical protein T265_08619 [Opisthorchis viverrini]KER23496.1 hypothetical protein T265_08619 [Opisthorchis viverrini]
MEANSVTVQPSIDSCDDISEGISNGTYHLLRTTMRNSKRRHYDRRANLEPGIDDCKTLLGRMSHCAKQRSEEWKRARAVNGLEAEYKKPLLSELVVAISLDQGSKTGRASLGDLAISRPSCFLRVSWQLGTGRMLQLNNLT